MAGDLLVLPQLCSVCYHLPYSSHTLPHRSSPHRCPFTTLPTGGLPGGEQTLDLLPSAGLVTSSEDYYPTVAINALMRVLREPSMASLHGKAVAALFEIIKAMGLSFVPYLPKVGTGRGVGGRGVIGACGVCVGLPLIFKLGRRGVGGWADVPPPELHRACIVPP